MTSLKLIVLILALLIPASSYADRAVTLPWTMNFDDDGWESDLALDECGGTSTHVTSGCYSGGCMKVTPPTSACTGGGTNGGQTGLGWVSYSSTNTIHIRFLIYVGTQFASGVLNGGGGLINKFILLDNPSRIGILGFNGSDTDGRYVAFGALDDGESYWFRTTDPGWIEYAPLKIKDSSRSGEWICVEYWVDTTTDRTGIYLWTEDGVFDGEYLNVENVNTAGSQGFYLSYFNSYGDGDEDNYYLIDNFVVSTEYIGPPSGFGEEAPTASTTISGATIAGGSIGF